LFHWFKEEEPMKFSSTRRSLLSAAFALAAVFAAGFAPSEAVASTLEDIKKKGTIRIAIDIGHPPYGMLDDKAQPTGLDVDTAKALAEDLGVKLEIVKVSGANRVPFLLSNQTDLVISSFSITEERKKVISYSEPYGIIPVMLAGPSSVVVETFGDVKGQNVAVARGTTSDIELTRANKEAGDIVTITRYEDEATTDTALQTGQHDWITGAPASINKIIDRNPDRGLEFKLQLAAYPMAIGLRQGEPELQAWVDAWVVENLKNGRLNTFYKNYFNLDLPPEMLNR